ncbi:hypothetical protein Bca4012_074030 [Brassica carinata]
MTRSQQTRVHLVQALLSPPVSSATISSLTASMFVSHLLATRPAPTRHCNPPPPPPIQSSSTYLRISLLAILRLRSTFRQSAEKQSPEAQKAAISRIPSQKGILLKKDRRVKVIYDIARPGRPMEET